MSEARKSADWIVSLSQELEPLVRQYSRDMEQLEDERRKAQGQARRELNQKIEQRRDQCCLKLLETESDGPSILVSGFADNAAVWFSEGTWQRRGDARAFYIDVAHKVSKNGALALPQALNLDPWPPKLLHDNWLGFEIEFSLQTPWYSKDDRPFHVLDNPVRKDRVFGVPYMSAASWKGLLRWAIGMTTGLIGPTPIEDKEKRKEAEATILHLFGNEKGATDDFQRGALAFYPTWFPRVGFEVINPHSRKTRAGTQPIYYEVVPARYQRDGTQVDTKATLRLLYAPLPGQAARDSVDRKTTLRLLIDATEKLLTTYGFSAKRTAGWGLATIDAWEARSGDGSKRGSRDEVVNALDQLLGAAEAKP